MAELHPDADVTDGGWLNEAAGSTLNTSIDELTINDSDYIRSIAMPQVSDVCEVALGDPGGTPSQPMTVSYRYKNGGTGGGGIDLTVTLLQGTTEIAVWEHQDISDTFVTTTQTLTSAEYATISDFTDLRLRFASIILQGWWISSSIIDIDFENNRAHDSTPLDSNLATTVLMLHGNGTDGSTNISDSTGRHFITNSSTEIDTAQSKFGGASIKLNSGQLTTETSSDFSFGTGNFTIDFWLRYNSHTFQTNTITLVGGPAFIIYSTNDDVLRVFNGSDQIVGTTALSDNTWYHVAFTRSGTNNRLFLDGTQEGSTWTSAADYSATNQVQIKDVDGWVEEVRILKGTAAWTANFSIPTAPYNVGISPYDMLSCSRASIGYAQTVAGTLTQFANNQLRITTAGLLVEDARTNVVLWNRDLTNGAWTPVNITAAKDQTGPDGVTNSASSITASAGNGTIIQAIVLGSSARYQSAWVKRITGSGTVNMTMDAGVTWTPITVTAGWTLVEIPTQTLANPTVGFRIVTSGDAIAVDFVQNEDGAFASSPIPTTTAAATRARDAVTLIGTLYSVLFTPTAASAVADVTASANPATTGSAFARIIGSSTGLSTLLSVNNSNTVIGNYTNPPTADNLTATLGNSLTFSGGVKVGMSLDSGGRSVVGGGGTVGTSAVAFQFEGADLNLGYEGSATARWYGYYRRVTAWSSRLADATLQSYTDPSYTGELIGAAVDLNFEDGTYYLNQNELLTMLSCSRASIGYAQTVAGTLTQFAANQLRITDKGLLIEDARTNVAVRLQTMNSGDWTQNQLSINNTAATAPDGTTTANQVTVDGTNNFHRTYIFWPSTVAVWTLSGYVKNGVSNGRRYLGIRSSDHSSLAIHNIVIDLTDGSVTQTTDSGSGNSHSVETLADGWYRFSIILNATSAGGGAFFSYYLLNTGTPGSFDDAYAGDSVSNVLIWGTQIELGAFASSYVPTTTAAATRAADLISSIGTLETVLSGGPGSAVADILAEGIVAFSSIITNANVYTMRQESATALNSYNALTLTATLGNSLTYLIGAKSGVSWDAGTARSLVGGGGTVVTDSGGNPVGGNSGNKIGSGPSGGGFNYFRRVTAWSSRLADATLQGFTAP